MAPELRPPIYGHCADRQKSIILYFMNGLEKDAEMTTDRRGFQLEPRSQTVISGGRRTTLQYKSWGVLMVLIDSAPETVTRAELIDGIWSGNYATGDKALSHALWCIRSALGDNAKSPAFVKTVPRSGYQWIGPQPKPTPIINAPAKARWNHPVMVAAGMAAMFCISIATTLIPTLSANPNLTRPPPQQTINATNGTSAHFQGADIIVDHFEGCRFILKASSGGRLNSPIFSNDGRRLAMRVEKADGCRLVVFEFKTRERIDFGACPAAPSPNNSTPLTIT